MAKAKTTVSIDEDLLRAAKVAAARQGVRDYEVFEAALRAYLGFDLLEKIWSRSGLPEDEAMDLAVREVRAARRERSKKS